MYHDIPWRGKKHVSEISPFFHFHKKNIGVEEVKLPDEMIVFDVRHSQNWHVKMFKRLVNYIFSRNSVRESSSMNRMWISRPFLWFTAGYQKNARLGSFWGIAVLKLYRKPPIWFICKTCTNGRNSRCDILVLLEYVANYWGSSHFWALAMWAVKESMVIWTIQGIRLQNRSWNRDSYLNQPT